MHDLTNYSGQSIDVAARQISKSEDSILEKADAFYRLNIDVLDQDTRAYTARILREADASGVTNESIELIRAAFKVELANGGPKSPKGIRKAEDVPRVDPPIWTLLDDEASK